MQEEEQTVNLHSTLRHHAFATFLAVLSLVCISGCSDSSGSRVVVSDSTNVVVEPGRGVSNVCEVGMTYEQIKRATDDASMHGSAGSQCVLVPGLGAIANLDNRARVESVLFFVRPYDSSSTAPGLVITRPFCGSLGDRLSFGGPIRKNQIEAAFGEIRQGITNSEATISYVSVDTIKKGEPLFVRHGEKEELYYPQHGLRFVLEGDAVVSFGVSRPEKPPGR